MNKNHWLSTVLAVFLMIHSDVVNAQSKYAPPKPSLEVTTTTMEFQDSGRKREVPVRIYAPTQISEPMPWIVFSHGLGGSRDGYEYLGQAWAGCGFISIHVQHLGSDDSVWRDVAPLERAKSARKSAADLNNAMDRPADVSFVIDRILAMNEDRESLRYHWFDPKRIGVAGHSFGSFTTMAIAGQTFPIPLGQQRQHADDRVIAAIAMSSPAPMNRRSLDRAYGSIRIPVMHMTGTKDVVEIMAQNNPEDRRIPFDHTNNAPASLITFKDGDHMIFSGRPRLADAAQQAADAAFQRLIVDASLAHWDAYLRDDDDAKKWIYAGGLKQHLGEKAVIEVKQP